jgi:hypothetical protein
MEIPLVSRPAMARATTSVATVVGCKCGMVLGPSVMACPFLCTPNPRSFRKEIEPVETDTFKLVIEKSVNPVTLNAAQVSEIELYPAAK